MEIKTPEEFEHANRELVELLNAYPESLVIARIVEIRKAIRIYQGEQLAVGKNGKLNIYKDGNLHSSQG